jgi:hypothetical protein
MHRGDPWYEFFNFPDTDVGNIQIHFPLNHNEVFIGSNLTVIVCKEQVSALMEFDILFQFIMHCLEFLEGFHRDPDAEFGRKLLPDAAYATTRGSGCQIVLFKKVHLEALFCKVVSSGGPDDPAADDDNVSCIIHR